MTEPTEQRVNTAEHHSWGECVDEMVICSPEGMVGEGDRSFRCTGGHHVGPGRYVRCISDYHAAVPR